MLEIIKVETRPDFHLHVVFSTNEEGDIDMKSYLWGEAFEPLKKKEEFEKVFLLKDLGTVAWPNGVDIAAESLYEKLNK